MADRDVCLLCGGLGERQGLRPGDYITCFSCSGGTVFLAPLVGQQFHKGAKKICEFLGDQAHVLIEREPDNKYDKNAIQVKVEKKTLLGDIPEDLPDWIVLGHIAARSGEAGWLAPIMDATGLQSIPAKFRSPDTYRATKAVEVALPLTVPSADSATV